MNQLRALVVLALVVALAGCAADDPNRRAKQGALIGGLLGGVAGHQVEDDKGRYVGAALGALAGAAVGNYMDQQARELERLLADEQAANELRISRMADGSVRLGIASEASFDVDSAQLSTEFLPAYQKIADVLKRYPKTVVWVVGHTDSTGSEAYNQRLSERRANSVASYLNARGVDAQRLKSEGRGENEPIASNQTEEGRRMNRRVDIVIKPVVEGQESQAYQPPPYLGR